MFTTHTHTTRVYSTQHVAHDNAIPWSSAEPEVTDNNVYRNYCHLAYLLYNTWSSSLHL